MSQKWHSIWSIYLFGLLCHFQHCTGHITTGSFVGRRKPVHTVGVKVLYCNLPIIGKQLPTFPHKARVWTTNLSQGHIAVGSLRVEETSAYQLVKILHCEPTGHRQVTTNFQHEVPLVEIERATSEVEGNHANRYTTKYLWREMEYCQKMSAAHVPRCVNITNNMADFDELEMLGKLQISLIFYFSVQWKLYRLKCFEVVTFYVVNSDILRNSDEPRKIPYKVTNIRKRG